MRDPGPALTVAALPPEGDAAAVFKFAMSFDGYAHFGSFEAAADEARQRKRACLADIRNELFMAARASKQCGDDGFLALYSELLPLFRRLLSGGSPP